MAGKRPTNLISTGSNDVNAPAPLRRAQDHGALALPDPDALSSGLICWPVCWVRDVHSFQPAVASRAGLRSGAPTSDGRGRLLPCGRADGFANTCRDGCDGRSRALALRSAFGPEAAVRNAWSSDWFRLNSDICRAAGRLTGVRQAPARSEQ